MFRLSIFLVLVVKFGLLIGVFMLVVRLNGFFVSWKLKGCMFILVRLMLFFGF